jgi:hypothetical protein
MTRRLALLVGAAAMVLAAGCGDDDDDGDAGGGDVEVSEEAQPYVDAMVEGMVSSDDDEDLQLDQEQADCLAPRWVETIGVERLQDAGLEPDDFADDGDPDLSSLGLSEDEGGELYDAFGACDIDLKAEFIRSFTADQDLSEEDAECLGDAFSDDFLRRIMITTLVEGDEALEDDQELTGELLSVFSECPGAIDVGDDGDG